MTSAPGRRLLWGIPLLVVLLWLLGQFVAAPAELQQAPLSVQICLPVVRFLCDAAAVMTVGWILVGGLILARRDRRLLRQASVWAACWLGLLAVQALLTAAEIAATQPTDTPGVAAAVSALAPTSVGQVFLVESVAVLVLIVVVPSVDRVSSAVVVSGLALAAASLPAALGHGGLSSAHVAATASLALHLAAMSVWVGGLVALLVVVRRDRATRAVQSDVVRFSSWALVCAIIVGETGLLNASLRLAVPSQFVATEYGSLVLVKAVLFAGLVVLGWQQRAISVGRLAENEEGTVSLLRLGARECGLMGAAIAVSVVLGRLGPPSAIPSEAPMTPWAVTVLALGLPFVLRLVRSPGPNSTFVRFPEMAAVGSLVVIAEVAAVGVARAVFGPEFGAVVGGLALVAAGWALSAAVGSGSRPALIVAMVGWPVVQILGVSLGGGGSFRSAVVAAVVAEGLILGMARTPRRRIDLTSRQSAVVSG